MKLKPNILGTWLHPRSNLGLGTSLSLGLSISLGFIPNTQAATQIVGPVAAASVSSWPEMQKLRMSPGLSLSLSMSMSMSMSMMASAQLAAQGTEQEMQELQVFATMLTVYETPSQDGLGLAQIYRGNLFTVLAKSGSWYKIRLESQLTGWVMQTADEFGQMTLDVFPAKGRTLIATSGAEETPTIPETPEALQSNGFNDIDATGVRLARPAITPVVVSLPSIDKTQIEPPAANLPRESIPIPDRWRLMQALELVNKSKLDPYNQNPLKGDLPVFKNLGPDYFVNISAISDTILELRRFPVPVGLQQSARPGANDVLGKGTASSFIENAIFSFSLIKGNTTFKPQDIELRFGPVFNFNRQNVNEIGLLRADPSAGTSRTDNFVGVQELFADIHLRNVSDRYDFDSVRIGIQPFTNDFRGFLFNDSPVGVRFFGTRDNNKYQYNLALFRRLDKDTNSGLNRLRRPRLDDLFVANLFQQDFPVLGFTSQYSLVHNRNREDRNHYDTNGFLVRPSVVGDVRPHRYNVTYLGYTGDGHLGRWNLSTSTYLALGHDEHNPIARREQQIRAGFFAAELARDISWVRVRGNLLLSSGDKNPFDGKSTGFDAIFENPIFAGSDTMFFIRQPIPLIGGGGVALSQNNSIIPSLRSSKNEGQSNFVNPGLALLGLGADFDIKPEFRMFANVSYLRFMDTSSLELLRDQIIPSKSIGYDFSVGFHYRPFFTQNIIINGSAAVLKPTKSLKSLFGENQSLYYSIVLNAIFTY